MIRFLLRKVLPTLALGLLAVSAMWGASSGKLVITTKSGSVAEIPVSGQLGISYQDNLLVLKGDGEEIAVEAAEVADFNFYPSESADKTEIPAEGSLFRGLTPGSDVEVYGLDGSRVKAFKADEAGSASVGLNELTTGVYVIRTSSGTLKYRKQ